ncbi:hypothetical protein ALQ60_101890 [Pseudomonas syringae pv. papulans]|nr:hypothetical protein ALO65_102014 [Pseudomonas syringae pv. papulans]RMN49777.1 hypothetical protein ALQ60_101890 [Pseudomonas syringae pv. papulans]RMN68161.1 hypothetical protein ALQ56_102673 [Pseudomonas syringae pv. papulans]RMV52187.1 hypothetical protein ALP11_102336 [Pseudomonas syringae pv. papulans]
MRTSLCKALLPRNCSKMAGSDGCLLIRQIAINAGPIGLRDQVKNPAFCQAQPVRTKGKINDRIQRHPPCHTDQSVQTNRNVLHHHLPTSDLKRQWSIFFN